TVRRVAAKIDPAHSFELWLIASQGAKPKSLGLVGSTQYTQRPLPADFNAATMKEAIYAISFEPAGGSKTGAPTGPVLFTGKLVQSVPPPPARKT
ncbi:MAG: anti-sigma factor domain-containing protein, partial [Xanthobacteraceae bacterium]